MESYDLDTIMILTALVAFLTFLNISATQSMKGTIMTVVTDIRNALDKALDAVRREKDARVAMKAALTAQTDQIKVLTDRITELEGMPGEWTDADVAEIKAGLQEISDAFPPDGVVEAVEENIPSPMGSPPSPELPFKASGN